MDERTRSDLVSVLIGLGLGVFFLWIVTLASCETVADVPPHPTTTLATPTTTSTTTTSTITTTTDLVPPLPVE